MAQSHAKIIVQQFKDWEIQILMLLSFALQLSLFFFGGLRRRSNRVALRIFLWLTYLSADYFAVYALGYLSRHLPTTTYGHTYYQPCLGKSLFPSQSHHDLTPLWAPFLLVHLGGQDTVTAFSIEDNELWSRHFLNMLVQVCLVLFVLWNSVANNRLVIPATLLFVAGVIKYSERIWALKGASQKGLKNSINTEEEDINKDYDGSRQEEDGARQHPGGYSSLVKGAHCFMPALRQIFARRKGTDMQSILERHKVSQDAQLAFKTVEVELSMIYDELYTKTRMILTRNGTILCGVSLTFTAVAFVVFILMTGGTKQRYYSSTGAIDIAITYTLFTGAFCLEACSIVTSMLSPRAWASREARGGRRCSLLTRVTWSKFGRMIHQLERTRWSNSVRQYNVVRYLKLVDDKSRIGKVVSMVGAKELWSSLRHTSREKVTAPMMDSIHQAIYHGKLRRPLNLPPELYVVLSWSFEKVLFIMHSFTELFLTILASKSDFALDEEMQILVQTFKGTAGRMLEDGQDIGAALQLMVDIWVRLLIYAAGKSPAQEHARQLSMGGELLTFVWLLMAHHQLGDVSAEQFELVERLADGLTPHRSGDYMYTGHTTILILFKPHGLVADRGAG
uniref:DUF4220 domain-containing protein n=1 Tax=Oryza brachyantha TaxID=4533 RepID=J3M6N3_ORYBR